MIVLSRFGEGFDTGPSVSKEHWLVEQSGVVFGMFSEMLNGPNLWKGMLFLETGRAPAVNMKPLYAVWDANNLAEMEICGWWNTTEAGCFGAATSEPEAVPLTVYRCAHCSATKSNGPAALLAIASFAMGPTNVTVTADWTALGFEPGKVELQAPAIAGFQVARTFEIGQAILVAEAQGWLLVVAEKHER